MRSRAALTLLTLLVLAAPAAARLTPSEELDRLVAQYHDWLMLNHPEEAMAGGDYSRADQVTDESLSGLARRDRNRRRFLNRLDRIAPETLDDDDDRLTHALFRWTIDQACREHEFKTYVAPFGVNDGPLFTIPRMTDRVRFETDDDYLNYLKRLEQVPTMIEGFIERMRLGLAEGRTPPRVTLAGIPGQFAAILAPGGLDALARPFVTPSAGIDPGMVDLARRRFDEHSLPKLRAALATFRDFVVDEYLPGCRETIAATDMPDGEAFYAFRLGVMTTTDLTAREIHEIGVREVARIRAEMMGVIRRSDYLERFPADSALDDESLFARFIEYLRTDPRFYYDEPEALLAGYRDVCKRIDAELPRFFHRLPRLTYGVKPVPAHVAPYTTTAYYSHGDIRNGQPGYFVANTYALDQRPTYEMIALALHEAVPGHHFQVAIAQELDDLPDFRKKLWVTAFGEGWALYAERLGVEMGLYTDPYDDFGRLTYEMWRACRLVVDPGIHALGWTRQEAIDFMLANSALAPHNIETEVDRYISWPGQACGYKIGELRIRAIRARAEETLGDRFDLRAFHDHLLAAGSIPLTVLEDRMDRWIEARAEEDRP